MASNRWQEKSHVPKETHLPSIELNTLERQKYEKTIVMHSSKVI